MISQMKLFICMAPGCFWLLLDLTRQFQLGFLLFWCNLYFCDHDCNTSKFVNGVACFCEFFITLWFLVIDCKFSDAALICTSPGSQCPWVSLITVNNLSQGLSSVVQLIFCPVVCSAQWYYVYHLGLYLSNAASICLTPECFDFCCIPVRNYPLLVHLLCHDH
mgnify:CR=1 FL=1